MFSPIWLVTTDSGRTFRCTPDHKWLIRPYERMKWRYETLEVGMEIARMIDVTPNLDKSLAFHAGWLSGIYDGEASGRIISQDYNHNPNVCKKIEEVCAILDIDITPIFRDSKLEGYYITGGRQGYVDFLNKINPIRREALEREIWRRAFVFPPEKIVQIQHDGFEEAFCLSTTSKNYVVYGFASHNTSEHPEKIEEILNWPSIKFEYLYRAHVRRKAIEEATAYKNAMVSGLMGNTNLDDGKQTRQNILNDIEERHLETIFTIYNGKIDEELDYESDPLFAAIGRNDKLPTTHNSDLDQDQ